MKRIVWKVKLVQQYVKHEVSDDFGAWADYCYQKEPVQIELRELTEEEAEVQEHLDLSRCKYSCQILLGIIELFIWDKGPFKDEILGDWPTMIQKIRDERRRVVPLWLYGIVDTWIYYCMDFCGKPVSEYSSFMGRMLRKTGERYYRIF